MTRRCPAPSPLRRWLPRLLLAGAASLLVGANPSPPHNWNAGYETDPADADNVSQGANWIRNLKTDIRERLEPEVHFGSINADDNGLLRVGSARCFVSSSAPTVIEQADHDNLGGAGTATLSDDATNSVPAEKVGHGRCWFNPTTGEMKIYNSTSGWSELVHAFDIHQSMVRNGGFEEEGEQALGLSTCTDSFTNDGSGNSCENDPTVVEDTTAGSNGFCDANCDKAGPPNGWAEVATPTDLDLVLNTGAFIEALGPGQVLEVTSDASGDGVSQTLDGLQENTTYAVRAWVYGGAAGDDCRIDVTGEASGSLPADFTGGTTPDVIGGVFTTDASATDVVLQLLNQSAGAADECHWDHVAVYPLKPDKDITVENYLYQWSRRFGDNITTLGPTRDLPWTGRRCKLKFEWYFNSDAGAGQSYDLQVDVNDSGAPVDLVTPLGEAGPASDEYSGSVVIDEDMIEATFGPIAAGDVLNFRIVGTGAVAGCNASSDSICRIIVQQFCGEY